MWIKWELPIRINNDEDQNSLKVALFDIDGTMSSEVPGKPMKIAGGGNHTMVILDNGKVFSCGAMSLVNVDYPEVRVWVFSTKYLAMTG